MITQIDVRILDFLQSIHNPITDIFFKYITYLGEDGFIWIVIALVLLFFKKTRKIGIMLVCSLILGFLTGNLILKNLIARDRPFVQNPEMLSQLLIHPPSEYSFPSGHTLSSFESATVIFLNNKKWGIAALILAAIIGFSRNYLYVHFPSDVLAGAFLGVLIGIFVYFMYNKIEYRIKH